jgi:hypothetical protein
MMKNQIIAIQTPRSQCRILAGWHFHAANAEFAYATTTGITYRDGHGNYAEVIGVKNPVAWLKRHGIRAEIAPGN